MSTATLPTLPRTNTRQRNTLRALARNSARGSFTTARGAGTTQSRFLDDISRLRAKGFEIEGRVTKTGINKYRLTDRSQITYAKTA